MVVLLVVVALIAILMIAVGVRNYRAFYTKSCCSLCGSDTGIKGNKRFKLKDGVACERCIGGAGYMVTAGPLAFAGNSVSDVSALVGMSEDDRKRYHEEKRNELMSQIQSSQNTVAHANTSPEPVKCPRCGSTQISSDKKGFGVGKAVIGNAIAGPIGLAAGNIGAKKVRITCLKCGKQWEAGK